MDNKEEIIQDETSIEEPAEEIEELEDQEEFTYTVDNNNINNDYTKNNDGQKSYIYLLVGFMVLALIIVTLIVLVNKKTNKTTGYTSIETKMKEAAKKYYSENKEQLPTTEEDNVTVTAETLIENSYLKPFTEMISEEETCTGYVNVYKSRDEYAYFPFLNCGTNYKSTKLNEKIINDNLVENGDGLYKLGNEYIFKGEYPNNYVKLNDRTWRIIKINEDGSLKLINSDKQTIKSVWDDRYNDDKAGYNGKNEFKKSRILEALNEIYDNDTYIKSESKKLLVKQDWCIGKAQQEDISISSLNLCSETENDLYIGLITIDEVLIPSLDENCNSIYDAACTNYNYLFKIDTGWTLNASIEKSYIVFHSKFGTITAKTASTSSTIRPVININSDILYKTGNGTSETPYIIEN